MYSKKHNHSGSSCKGCKVRELSLFAQLLDDTLNVAGLWIHHQENLSAKSMLFHQNSRPHYVRTLRKGWVMLYKTTPRGNRQILRFALPGDLLGFKTNENGHLFYSAMAITEAQLCSFKQETLTKLIGSNPLVASQYFRLEAKKTDLYHHYLTGIGQKTAKARIAFLLQDLFQRSQAQYPETFNAVDNSILFPITQEDIGDALGLTNVHVNRIINELKKSKIIQCENRRLFVHDMDRLRELAECD